jgi:hypothetical protein
MDEKWDGIEPNTGVMHVRATNQGINFYKAWLARVVKTNVRNDQVVFDRDSRAVQRRIVNGQYRYDETNFTSTFTPTCNWDYKNTNTTIRATLKAVCISIYILIYVCLFICLSIHNIYMYVYISK